MEKFVIIDGNSILNRAFYALPMLANFKGEISNGVFGFTNMLTKVMAEVAPKYIAVAFDVSRKTFRNEIYPQYKGTRKETPEELKSQFPILKELLKTMNITCIEKEGIEADDIIGSLSKKFTNVEKIILSGDKDVLQLIDDTTKVMFTKKGISETIIYDNKQLMEDYGLVPSQIIEMKALMGDSSDNIPGVPSVGEKTALSLLYEHKSLDGIYKNIESVKGKLGEKLVENKDLAYLCKELATIKTDFALDFSMPDFEYTFPFSENVREFFKRYQFNSLLKRADIFANAEPVQHSSSESIKVTNMDSVVALKDKLLKQKEVAIYMGEVLSLSFGDKEYNIAFEGNLIDVGLDIEKVVQTLRPVFESTSIRKVVFDCKDTMHRLHHYGVGISNVTFDVLLARYIINVGGKANASFTDLLHENGLDSKSFASSLFLLKNIYDEQIKALELEKLYKEIEMPLVEVLFNMEISGFRIDEKELDVLESKYEKEILSLSENIFAVAGKRFNINSPKQVAEILFDDLNLVTFNNKKRSTRLAVLEELVGVHPIIQDILRYRQIYKLYTTYVKAFKKLINPKTGKIYTLFNQMLTSTGRLSSSEPNLQNIPIRSDEGRELRKIFVPSHKNGSIVSADYNQIELRLMASFSGDEKLVEAYKHNKDIHTTTASEIFGVHPDMVKPAMRRDAKAINFGIIYGISDYGLSQNIGTSRQNAAEYIKMYFERYPSVKQYMDKSIAFAKENGYIKTLFGRIRNLPEINSSNYNLRMFGERAAMNMPLQGSASDIIKLAMISVFNKLQTEKLESKLILQVHDELIIDCAKGEEKAVSDILRECMESVVKLAVKLPVNISIGANLYESN